MQLPDIHSIEFFPRKYFTAVPKSVCQTPADLPMQHIHTYASFLSHTDCNVDENSQAQMSCRNDTLTVTWRTTVTFDSSVKRIPSDLLHLLIYKTSTGQQISDSCSCYVIQQYFQLQNIILNYMLDNSYTIWLARQLG